MARPNGAYALKFLPRILFVRSGRAERSQPALFDQNAVPLVERHFKVGLDLGRGGGLKVLVGRRVLPNPDQDIKIRSIVSELAVKLITPVEALPKATSRSRSFTPCWRRSGWNST